MSSDRARRAAAAGLTLGALAFAPDAGAQACCAGSSAVTPARLGLHEDALVGATLRVAGVVGNYALDGTYSAQPPHTSELDLEQDLVAAARVTKRGQLALLVPFVETVRSSATTSGSGGGLGDINLGARYDLVLAGESRYLPGIALLAGLTLPTGRPVEAATQPLATDATGIGAFQGNLGLSVEQVWGPWLASLSGLVAQRAPRSVQGVDETLGTQLTGVGAVAYTFRSAATAGVVVSYAAEGDARINGAADQESHKRALTLSAVGVFSFTDSLRLQGSLFLTPPVTSLGANQPATCGLTLTALLGLL